MKKLFILSITLFNAPLFCAENVAANFVQGAASNLTNIINTVNGIDSEQHAFAPEIQKKKLNPSDFSQVQKLENKRQEQIDNYIASLKLLIKQYEIALKAPDLSLEKEKEFKNKKRELLQGLMNQRKGGGRRQTGY